MEIDDFITFFSDLAENTGLVLGDLSAAQLDSLRANAEKLFLAVGEEQAVEHAIAEESRQE